MLGHTPERAYDQQTALLACHGVLDGFPFVACGRNGSTGQDSTERTVYVGPELVDCANTGERQCLQLREGASGGWFYLNGAIEGFQYEQGYEYELQILEEEGDGAVKLSLIQMVNKVPVDMTASQVAVLVPTGATSLGQEVWAEQGVQPGFQVREEVQGWCALGSMILAHKDAWRCYTRRGDLEETLDPCIPNPYNAQAPLACVKADRSVTLLAISDTLPIQFANQGREADDLPAVVWLENTDECDLVTGEAPLSDGKTVSYRCHSGSILVGPPNRAASIWTIEYSADADGKNRMVVPVVRAAAFRGDTAWTGGGPVDKPTGVLASVVTEVHPGRQRIIFEFSAGGLPPYDLLYTNEPAKEMGTDQELPVQGSVKLRMWFSAALAPTSPKTNIPAYAGLLRMPIAGQSNIKEVVCAGEKDGEMEWYIGMDAPAGFHVTEEANPPRLVLDLYDPVAGAADRPMLVLGSQGPAVRALQETLVAQGYLAMRPAEPNYDEDTWQAVAVFEEKHGLNPDGVAGPEVWAALARSLPEVQMVAAVEATPEPEALGLPRTRAKSIPAAMPLVEVPPDTINIVLLGTDQLKPGKIWRTDSIIILSVNTKNKTAGMLSIPRDLWVYIPTIGYNRINTADVFGYYGKYPGGSAELVKATIQHNLGIPIHYYVRGSLLALISLVDTLGGIDVAVDCSLYDANFRPPVNLKPGVQHMDGRTALRYARSRYSTNDFDRSRRQQRVLRAIWDKALQVNVLPKVPDIWNSLASYIQTDLSTGDILSLAYMGVQLRPQNIRTRVIGYGQVRDMIGYGGAMVLVSRPSKLQEAVTAFLDPSAPSIEPEKVRVILKNGTAKEQYTELAVDRLHWEGMSVVTAPADRQDYAGTELIIYGSRPDIETRLVDVFDVAPENVQHHPEAEKPAEGDVLLVLGGDYSPCER